jgi:hypothetical protein
MRASLGQDELRLATIEGEISALKAVIEKRESPWNSAVVISLVALLLSIGTTAFSYIREKEQYIHDTRAELRGLVQSLNKIPIDNIEYAKNKRTRQQWETSPPP